MLYNNGKVSGNHKAVNITVEWNMLPGWGGESGEESGEGLVVSVRDLWEKKDIGNFSNGFTKSLKGRDVMMLRLRKV